MLRVFGVMTLVYLWLVHLKTGRPAFAPLTICRFVEYPNIK